MVIWSGFGILAGIIPVLCYVLMAEICAKAYGSAYLTLHSWPGALGTLVGALAVYVLSEKVDARARTLIDPQTGESLKVRRNHSLLFIPLRYWTYILLCVSVYILIFKHESTI